MLNFDVLDFLVLGAVPSFETNKNTCRHVKEATEEVTDFEFKGRFGWPKLALKFVVVPLWKLTLQWKTNHLKACLLFFAWWFIVSTDVSVDRLNNPDLSTKVIVDPKNHCTLQKPGVWLCFSQGFFWIFSHQEVTWDPMILTECIFLLIRSFLLW